MRRERKGGEEMNKLDGLYIGVRLRLEKAWERFKGFWASQDGVSNVVATIIILLIVVLIIAVFWDKLQVWLKNMMDIIFGTEIKPDKLGGS